jgi:hypothetical protein
MRSLGTHQRAIFRPGIRALGRDADKVSQRFWSWFYDLYSTTRLVSCRSRSQGRDGRAAASLFRLACHRLAHQRRASDSDAFRGRLLWAGWAVAGPDGKVSTGAALRFERDEYEARIIASDPRAKTELERRETVRRELEADAKLAAMSERSAA